VQNWAGNITYSATRLAEPESVEELQTIVAGAAAVRAVGSGHSFSPVADTTGTLVSLRNLALPTVIDAEARTATVPAGARYTEVTADLDARGWALPNLGSLPHITVGGACATGTHGSGDRNRNLAGAVVGVEFVRGDGELVRCALGEPEFAGSVLALGALGIATRMTLRLEPAYSMRQDVFTDLPLDRAAERVDDIFAAAYSVSLFSDFARPDVLDLVWCKSRGDAPPSAAFLGTPADRERHPTPGLAATGTSPQLGAVGPWHERLPHFDPSHNPSTGDELQSEYFLPRHRAGAGLAALRAAAADFAGALQVFEMRTIAADDLWLSPCHGRDTVAAHFTWVSDFDLVRPALAAVERALGPLDARPHWAKVFLAADRSTFESIYPRLPDFRALADRHDPERRFGNDFVARYVYA
jgi:xylitol oxidase